MYFYEFILQLISPILTYFHAYNVLKNLRFSIIIRNLECYNVRASENIHTLIQKKIMSLLPSCEQISEIIESEKIPSFLSSYMPKFYIWYFTLFLLMELPLSDREFSYEDFIDEIRNTRISVNFNVLCYFVNFDVFENKEDFYNIFLRRNNKIESLGDIDKLIINLPDGRETYYYLYFDYENSILLVYTIEKIQDIDDSIDYIIDHTRGTYYLPINFTSFLKTIQYLKNEYDQMCITFFTAFHHPKFRTKGLHRPEIRRSIRYNGQDGLDAFYEMRKYYGILPRTVEYDIKEYGKCRVNHKGRFTLNKKYDEIQSWELFFDILQYVLNDILIYKKIISKSNYQIIPYKTDTKVFNMPTSIPWIVDFKTKLVDDDLNEFKQLLDEQRFTIYNSSEYHGNSFTLSSMIYDEKHNNKFSIHLDNNKFVVIPYEKNILESFIRLYELLSEYNPDSELRGS